MSCFDIILLIIIGVFGLIGLWFGLLQTLGSLLGTILGVFLATRYYAPVSHWLMEITGWGANFSRVLIFIIVFFAINRLTGLAFWLINKILSIFTKLPLVGGVNRLFGLLFGLFEGTVVLGVIFYFIVRFPLGEKFMHLLTVSVVVPWTLKISAFLLPLVPEALKMLQSTIQKF